MRAVVQPVPVSQTRGLETGKRVYINQRLASLKNLSHYRRMKIGYARVSTVDQTPALQLDALRAAGCERIFTDEGLSGSNPARPALAAALAALAPGDVLTVWKLDRLGRSMGHLVNTVEDLGKRGIGFRSLSEAIDSTTAHGTLLFHLMAGLAQFERALIVERTRAGLAAARLRGSMPGRKPVLTAERIAHAKTLLTLGEPAAAVAKTLGVSRATFYRRVFSTS
jgi:DNA invertase Pin-like site-specific DNA recombinase